MISFCCKMYEMTQTFVMANYVKGMTAKKFCKYTSSDGLSMCSSVFVQMMFKV